MKPKPTPEYSRAHYLVVKIRGKARDQICACGSQAMQWAQIHDTELSDVMNFVAMCIACHRRYDSESYALNTNSAKLSKEDVFEIRNLLTEGRLSRSDIAEIYGVGCQAISEIKHGRTWSWLL